MNAATLTLTLTEIALLRQVTSYAAREGTFPGLSPLQTAIDGLAPDLPFHLGPIEIAAADTAFARIAESQELPSGLPEEDQKAFHHLKAMIAAAAVD